MIAEDNLLINIRNLISGCLALANSSEAAVEIIRQVDGAIKFGYIKSSLADDPLMIDVLSGLKIADWVLDEHKGELRERVEETLSFWFYDQSVQQRDPEVASLMCLLVIIDFCHLGSVIKIPEGSVEYIALKMRNSSNLKI